MPVHDAIARFDLVLGDVGVQKADGNKFTARLVSHRPPTAVPVLIELVGAQTQKSKSFGCVNVTINAVVR